MGAAEFSDHIALPLSSTLYLKTPIGSNIRENTGVSLSISKLVVAFKELTNREHDVAERKSNGS